MKNKKYTLLTEHFPSETFIISQAQMLDCSVVAGTNTNKPIDLNGEVRFISSANGFRGSRLQRIYRRVCEDIFSLPGPRWQASTEENWQDYLKEARPQAVLACFGTNGIRALHGCKKLGIPLIVQFLGQDASMYLTKPSFRKALLGLFKYASAVVVLNDKMRARLVKHGCEENKIFVIPIGVPTDICTQSDRYESMETYRFLAVGRFVDKKSPLHTVRAFERCYSLNKACRLCMVGDGPLLQQCKDYVAQHNLGDAVTFTGSLSPSELETFWKHAHCFVQHSVTALDGDAEGWPVSIAQAAVYGLPVVATRHEGIPDEVIDNESGYLVDEYDWQTMSEKMLLLSRDVDMNKRFAYRASMHIKEHGDMETQAGKLLDLLEAARIEH